MSLLIFLPVIRDKFNNMNLKEGIAVRLLSYILKNKAREVCVAQTSSGYQSKSFSTSVTWPFFMNYLISHYLHEDVLQ